MRSGHEFVLKGGNNVWIEKYNSVLIRKGK